MLVPISFPRQQDYARLLFEEALRHTRDSYILHRHRRYPASIASSLKTVEMALKSLLLLDASTTLIPDLFQTHRVFHDVILKYDVFTTTHLSMIENYDGDLRRRIVELEKLNPGKPSAKVTGITKTENAEYPFFEAGAPSSISSANTSITTRIHAPGSYFKRDQSARHLRTARRLLMALQVIYPDINAWGLVL